MENRSRSKPIRGKLKVYRYLQEDGKLSRYLPLTLACTESNLKQLQSIFSIVYIKPDRGSQGKGIYRLSKRGKKFILESGKKTIYFSTLSSVTHYLAKEQPQKMLAQQGIHLEKVQGRPYDIRAMVQRKPGGKWVCTGIIAKIGAPNKVVTNYSQGGKLSLMNKLFSNLRLSKKEQEIRMNEIEQISLDVAKVLSSKKEHMYQMGIDIAYDQVGKPWIIEVNTLWPALYPIKKVDSSMYQRMLRIAKTYGRYH